MALDLTLVCILVIWKTPLPLFLLCSKIILIFLREPFSQLALRGTVIWTLILKNTVDQNIRFRGWTVQMF